MEILDIILSISAIISMGLAVAIGLKNGIQSIFISAILYVFAIDFIIIILRDSDMYNSFWIRFPLIIPNMLLGVFASIHTRMQLSNKLKFKDYYVFGIITLVLLFIYLLINKADKSSQVYLVLKSSINFCFIFISLIILYSKLEGKEQLNKDDTLNLKNNKRFLIALFVIVITDFTNMCLCGEVSKDTSYILCYSVFLIVILYIGYNELFSRRTKYYPIELALKESYCDTMEDIDETESTLLSKNNIIANKIILSDERISEIATKIDNFFLTNKEFQRDYRNKLKNLSEIINEKSIDISYVLKTHYNTNYNNYINLLRIEEAKNIIINNTLNHKVDDIGVMVGFNTKNSFYIAFKKFTGVTPAKYK